MNDFMEILDRIEKFDYESQSVLVDIINKRFSEKRCELFIKETVESIEEIKTGSSDDLFKRAEYMNKLVWSSRFKKSKDKFIKKKS